MKMAMIPLGAGTIGFGLGLAIAGWRGDLTAQDAAQSPLSARSAAPARSASPAAQAIPPPPPRVLPGDGPVVPDASAVDGSLPDDVSSAIGEPEDTDSYLAARDRAAAHSARSR